jgi:hypothetical protein
MPPRRLALSLMVCLSLCVPIARAVTDSIAATDSNTAAAPSSHTVRRGGAGAIEERVNVFTRALALDATQQAQLRKILMNQREAVLKIWTDKTLSPAERAPATLAAQQRTGDEIREILNEEQRKKYNADKPATARVSADKRSVEQWLDATRAK